MYVLQLQMKLQWLPHIFDHARLRYGTVDIDRHPERKMAAIKPEVEITVERKEMAMRFQRLTPHC